MRFLWFLFLLCTITLATADNLKVLTINHGILRADGQIVKAGSQFDSKARIDWDDDSQVMKVINMTSHDVSVYAARLFKISHKSSIEELLVQKHNLSSRDGVLMNPLDFANFFNRNIALMNAFSVNTGYSFDEQHFLFLQYDYNGEMINKKLTCREHSVMFDDNIFCIDGKPIEPTLLKASLFFYDCINNQMLLLADNIMFHVAPRKTCLSFINFYCGTDISLEELSELTIEYCNITYPDIVFLPSDIDSFIKKVMNSVQETE